MRKRLSRDKEFRLSKEKTCQLCQSALITTLDLPPANLRKKYYHPQVETYHYRAANNLLYDPYSLQNIQLIEMRKQMEEKQSIGQYYTFSQTAMAIRGVITHRVEKDFYGWVDFQPGHFMITNAYYMRRKQLVQSGRKMEKYLKSTSDLQSTGSGDDKHVRQYIRQRIKKQLDQQRLVLPNETNSIIDIQKLTKNISIMVEKIADLSTIHPVNYKKKPRPTLAFQFSNCGQISAIQLTQQAQKCVQMDAYQELYGLQAIKPKHNKQSRAKKVNKLGIRSIDRLGIEELRLPPATPSPNMIHRFDYADEDTLSKRARGSKAGPLSPCSNSTSSLRSSISNKKQKTSKNKSRSSRMRV